MDSAILRSLTPGLGDSSAFARVTPEAARGSSGYAVPGAASVHTRNDEQNTNPTASYPILCRRWRNHDQQYLKEGDFIFVNTGKQTPATNSGRQPVVAANLQQVNTLCRVKAAGGEPAQCQGGGELCLAKHWQFFGIMRNEMCLNGGAGAKPHADRILNVDVRGRSVRVANLWPNSQIGDHVGFVRGDVRDPRSAAEKLKYLPKPQKVAYYAGKPDGSLRNLKEVQGFSAAKGKLDKATSPQKKFEAYQEMQAILAKQVQFVKEPIEEQQNIWVPYNFSQLPIPDPEDEEKELAKDAWVGESRSTNNRVIYVGVISDLFRPPLKHRETVSRALTELNPRFELPTCEIFVRIT